MLDHERHNPPRAIGTGTVVVAASTPSRINVAVNAAMLSAIDDVIDTDDVSLTEAVRRLLGYGDLVHRMRHKPGYTVFVRDDQGQEHEIVAL